MAGRGRRLGQHRNSRGQLWVNVTSSDLLLPDFVNLDHGFAPLLAAAYPALHRAGAVARLLRASRTLRLFRRLWAAGVARLPRSRPGPTRLAGGPKRGPLAGRLPLPGRLPAGQVLSVGGAARTRRRAARTRPARGRTVRGQWEAARSAVVARHDTRARLPFEAGSVDHILCAHVLQELPPTVMSRVLADYARVLRPGGTLHVVLPDLRHAVDRYVRGEIDADELVAWQRLRSPAEEGAPARWRGALGRVVAPGATRPYRWQYDAHTARRRLVGAGFTLSDEATPSSRMRSDDPGSLHLVAVRP